jgi:xanthine dehydrogenase YagR molybdenum-binding subunit
MRLFRGNFVDSFLQRMNIPDDVPIEAKMVTNAIKSAQSQVEGGIIQGVGHTLSEERLVDLASGRVLTQTLDTYKLPTIADVPELVVELLDIPDEHLTNLGSKGLGEPPIVPTAAAIVNAIRDATGADVRSLPVTREEMLRALAEAREREKLAAAPA